MALQTFGVNSSSIGIGVRAPLGTTDDAFVDFGATVSSKDDEAIVGTGSNHFVNVQGTVMADISAVHLGDGIGGDSSEHLLIGPSGYVGSFSDWTVRIQASDSTVDNRGTIWGGSGYGVFTTGTVGTTSVLNSGTIEASLFGILHSGTDVLVINNSGVINSPLFAIDGSSGVDQVTNTGRITGGILFNGGDDIYNGAAGRLAGRVFGGDGNDTIIGGIDNDEFFGDAANDILRGNAGNDALDGGAGADQMFGGAGNDTYFVDNPGDIINETGGSGIDLVKSSISFSLANTARVFGAVENLTLTGALAINGTGNALANIITGNGAANILNGGLGNDVLSGGLGNDTLHGEAGNDTLSGGLGNDRLHGEAGNDRLIGGAGNDFFVFDTALNTSTNRDIVTDFNHVADTFQLENAIFTKLGAGVHPLNAAFFHAGAAAGDANDFIVYNQATGLLSYDSNGSAAGGVIAFAVLTNKPALAANDFAVI
jgi:Ca2+-binding RTX toxin-like protein